MNFIGVTAALATFLGIWLGHVAVREIEARAQRLWLPIGISLILGLGLEICSLLSHHPHISAATGIFGITLLWDSFEFWRQEKRVRRGHAPANPQNPRHMRLLAESNAATTLDLLNRAPIGRPVDAQEARQLVITRRNKI